MPINCPHCNGEVTQPAIDQRIADINEKRLLAERERDGFKLMAAKATNLGARANGFDATPDAIEMLEFRHNKAKSAGYEGDFLDWLADAKGAKADPIASRLVAAAPSPVAAPAVVAPPEPAAPPAPAAPAAESAPTAPPVSRLPNAAPTTTTPAVSPRLTAEQVTKKNEPLKKSYEQAIQSGNKDRAAQLRAEIDANWKLMGDAP